MAALTQKKWIALCFSCIQTVVLCIGEEGLVRPREEVPGHARQGPLGRRELQEADDREVPEDGAGVGGGVTGREEAAAGGNDS